MSEVKLNPEKCPKSKFSEFGLNGALLKGIDAAGFTKPSPIQEEVIPQVLSGIDLVGQSQTGSGKTAAFVIPALEAIDQGLHPSALVLVPTRELAKQVVGEFSRLGKFLKLPVVTIVGGEAPGPQIRGVNKGGRIVVATPGRMLDHLKSQVIKKFQPSLIIVDEADELLDMGFFDDIQSILKLLPAKRQTLLFSATMPSPIKSLIKRELTDPKFINLTTTQIQHVDIEQKIFLLRPKERRMALVRLIDAQDPKKILIFCRTKRSVDELCEFMSRSGIKTVSLHGDMSQRERNVAINDFKSGYVKALVATDVASRGLDVPDLSHVVNYDPPQGKERYKHRIGRTGRAGNKGWAFSFVTPSELSEMKFLFGDAAKEFEFSELPSRTEIEKVNQEKFIELLENTPETDEAIKFCNHNINEDNVYDMVRKLYSFVYKMHEIKGPEKIGLDFKELNKIKQRRPSTSRARNNNFFSKKRAQRSSSGRRR